MGERESRRSDQQLENDAMERDFCREKQIW